MAGNKRQPLLYAADRRLRLNLLSIAAALAAAALLLILAEARYEAVSTIAGPDIYKLLVQFFLITAGGGVLLAIVGNARDETSRRHARAASVQSLQRELDSAYRALKKTKRTLRAHRLHAREAQAADLGRDVARQRVARPAFEAAMADLLEAQLQLESICDHIGQRNDVLNPARLDRMTAPLRYFSRFYHDVHEDFEKGPVRLEDDYYVLDEAANLIDFLRSSHVAPRQRPDEIEALLERLEKAPELRERAEALGTILQASPEQPGDDRGVVRYVDVASACYDLLCDELDQVRIKLLS